MNSINVLNYARKQTTGNFKIYGWDGCSVLFLTPFFHLGIRVFTKLLITRDGAEAWWEGPGVLLGRA